MQSKASTVEEYISQVAEDKIAAVKKLRSTIKKNLPKGFKECIAYGMIGYVVPHSLYPPGYHCDPKLPLQFAGLAAQKNFVAFYHMGIYCSPKLLKWFVDEYPKHTKGKLDMGKSCIRFKKMDDIPYALIGELVSKISVTDWINLYEGLLNSSKKSKQ